MTARVFMLSTIVVLSAALLDVLPARADDPKTDTESLVGKPAPDFQLTTLDNKQVKLSDLKGDVVVVDFWATWCPPCRKSLPHLQSVSQNQNDAKEGLKVWAVNARESNDKVEKFMKDNNYSFTVPLDSDGKTLQAYLVRGIPTTVIIGRDGKIRNVFVGYGGDESAKQIDDSIAAALKEPKPTA